MDNDILINQARQLYVALLANQLVLVNNSERLEHLITYAYCRYLRRLNRCAICYLQRQHDCDREPGEKRIPCGQPSRS